MIEPLDPGKIAAIHVVRGQAVKAGDLLLELDPAEAKADATSAKDALDASVAEMARSRYAIDAVRAAQIDGQGARDRLDARSQEEAPTVTPLRSSNSPESGMKVAWGAAVPERFRLRQEAVLRADLAQLSTRSRRSTGRWRRSSRRKSAST